MNDRGIPTPVWSGWTLLGLAVVACLVFPFLLAIPLVGGLLFGVYVFVRITIDAERHKRALRGK